MKKAKTRVVTGYVPLPSHPRSMQEYEKLGYQLSDALGDHPLAVYYERVPQLWLTNYIEPWALKHPGRLTWSKGDNPQKNSLEYHCINHQKFEWLWRASQEDSESDTFIWMDYGIFSQPGMDAEVIRSFLGRVRKYDFAFPGCWGQMQPEPSDDYPCWRFCGSMLIVPREEMRRLVECTMAMARLYINLMSRVTWEVNTLARVEPYLKKTAFRWYEADHNASQFGNYQ